MTNTITPKTISNSEVSSYLTCQRKHFYAHGLGIQPKTTSVSLSRGVIGHEMLAEYYSVLQEDPRNIIVARNRAYDRLDQHAIGGNADLPMLVELRQLVSFYFDFHADDTKLFDILEVEKYYKMPLSQEYQYGMRLDLLVQMKTGPYIGEKIIIDHKFLYAFPDASDIMLNAQLPKYIATLRQNGMDVKRGMLNTLRWRVTKANTENAIERFKRDIITPTDIEIRNIMKDQVLVSERITHDMGMGIKAYGETATRVLNKMICQNCPFQSPCKTELMGEDISLMLQTDFEKNTYGYGGDNK